MLIDFSGFDPAHLEGQRATHPIAPRWPHHAALLVLAGTGLRRPHALPGTPITARSSAFNSHF